MLAPCSKKRGPAAGKKGPDSCRIEGAIGCSQFFLNQRANGLGAGQAGPGAAFNVERMFLQIVGNVKQGAGEKKKTGHSQDFSMLLSREKTAPKQWGAGGSTFGSRPGISSEPC